MEIPVNIFTIQRYLIPLDLITGLFLWLALDWFIPAKMAKISAFVFLAFFCLFSGWRPMLNTPTEQHPQIPPEFYRGRG